MRIALLTNFIPPYRVPLLEALSARVDTLKVFVSTPMEPNRSWKPEWGTLDVAVQKAWTFRQTWRHPQGFEDTAFVHVPYDTLAQLRRFAPDAVVSGEMGLRTLLAIVYGRILRDVPIVLWLTISEHTEQGRGGARRFLRRWMFRRVQAVLVNGKSGARYARRYGITDKQLFFAPYTPDVAGLSHLPLERTPKQEMRLLYVGQFAPRKGLLPFMHTLCRWAKDHPEHQVDFRLAGDGPQLDALQAMAVPENVHLRFLGHVPFEQLPNLYGQAGMLVFPTLADEWGLVVNEAMVAGVPVLGSRYSQAVEELVIDDSTGWSFRPDHPDEVYLALDRAFETPPEQRQEMRWRARETALSITPDRIAEQIKQALQYAMRR